MEAHILYPVIPLGALHLTSLSLYYSCTHTHTHAHRTCVVEPMGALYVTSLLPRSSLHTPHCLIRLGMSRLKFLSKQTASLNGHIKALLRQGLGTFNHLWDYGWYWTQPSLKVQSHWGFGSSTVCNWTLSYRLERVITTLLNICKHLVWWQIILW